MADMTENEIAFFDYLESFDFDFGLDFGAMAQAVDDGSYEYELPGEARSRLVEECPRPSMPNAAWFASEFDRAFGEALTAVEDGYAFGLDAFEEPDPDEAAGCVEGYCRPELADDAAEYVAERLTEELYGRLEEALTYIATAYATAQEAKRRGFGAAIGADKAEFLASAMRVIAGVDYSNRIAESSLVYEIGRIDEDAAEA